MARPIKEGLDYFDLDCRLDDKIKLIEVEFGLQGFAIIVKLLQKIYGERGYYCEWQPMNVLLFARECGLRVEKVQGQALVPSGVGVNSSVGQVPYPDKDSCYGVCNLLNELIKASIRWDIFSKEIFDKYQVLTSKGIQKRYLNATSRREIVELKKEYLLVKVGSKNQNVVINSINVNVNSINVDGNTQSRVEESREEKREGDLTPLFPFGKFQNVMLTDAEYAEINGEYENINTHLDDISIILANAPKVYRNHYAFVLKIARADKWPKRQVAEIIPEKSKDMVPMPEEIRAKMKNIFKEV